MKRKTSKGARAMRTTKASKPKACGIEGCSNAEYRRKGLCKPHLDGGYVVEQLCEIDGCEEKVYSKAKCENHYQGWRRRERGEVKAPLGPRGPPKTHGVSTRVTESCGEVLLREGRGHPNTRAAEILEDYARKHAAA